MSKIEFYIIYKNTFKYINILQNFLSKTSMLDTKMTQLIEDLVNKHNIQIAEIKEKKNRYKNELKFHYEIFNKYEMESIDDVINYIESHNDDERRDKEIMDSWGFNTLDDVTEFINKYRNHICNNKTIEYLCHDDLMKNNYYSQLINSCYIINKQLKEEKARNERLYKEVTYLRNLYMEDSVVRERNSLLDLGIEDNLYIKSYVSEMINNQLDYDIIYKIIEDKKKTRKCDDNICIEFIPNKFKYCYHHYDLKMKKNTPKIINNQNYSSLNSWNEYKNYLENNINNENHYYELYISKYENNIFINNTPPKKGYKKRSSRNISDQEAITDDIIGKIRKSLNLFHKKKTYFERKYL